jgi:IS4 transposase
MGRGEPGINRQGRWKRVADRRRARREAAAALEGLRDATEGVVYSVRACRVFPIRRVVGRGVGHG